MGLGKTIQTLCFLSALKAVGVPGPHLIVTPLAVLQNWHNEIKKFTPGLSAVKVYGNIAERGRILSDIQVQSAGFDIYLTTYDTILSEEGFFTEDFLFTTITIDEGHRLRDDSAKLNKALSRISTPFRLLLTGTPLQNSLPELWALMHYILPEILSNSSRSSFEQGCSFEGGQLDRVLVTAARSLLETFMLRRVKSEVETDLLPKLQFVLKVPLSNIQLRWYRRLCDWREQKSDNPTRLGVNALLGEYKIQSILCSLSVIK